MPPVLLALALILLVVAGSYASFRYVRALPGLRYVYLVGTEFFLVGVAFGPSTSGLIGRETLMELAPVFSLGLAWIGLLYGLQFNIHQVLRVPRRLWLASFLQFLLVCVLMVTGLLGVKRLIPGTFLEHWPSLFGLALILSPASLPFLSLLHKEEGFQFRKELASVRTVAALDDLYPLIGLFALSLMTLRSGGGGVGDVAPWQLIGMPVLTVLGISFVCALSLNLLVNRLLRQDEFFMVVLAASLLIAGMATAMGFSPLVTGFLSGVVVANASKERNRIVENLETVEKPVYLLVLILLGAYLDLNVRWSTFLLIAVSMLLLRTISRNLGSYLNSRMGWVEGRFRHHATLLLPLGGMSVAMAGSFAICAPGHGSPVSLVMFMVLVVSEIQAPLGMRRLARTEQNPGKSERGVG